MRITRRLFSPKYEQFPAIISPKLGIIYAFLRSFGGLYPLIGAKLGNIYQFLSYFGAIYPIVAPKLDIIYQFIPSFVALFPVIGVKLGIIYQFLPYFVFFLHLEFLKLLRAISQTTDQFLYCLLCQIYLKNCSTPA